MKTYVKTLALVLLAGLSLASCLDDDRFNPEYITYPTELSLGVFATEYTPGNYEYNAVITKNAAGDTILYVIRTGKPEGLDSGSVSTLLISESIAYDDSVGMYTAASSYSAFGEDVATTVYMAYQRDQQQLVTQILANGKVNTMVFKPTTEQKVFGMWQGETEDVSTYLVCWLYPFDAEGNGKGVALFDADGDVEEVTYTFDGTSGQIIGQESGFTATIRFNADHQFVATVNGIDIVLDPITSDPVMPEYSFDRPLLGDFTYKVLWNNIVSGLKLVPKDISNPGEASFTIEHWGKDVTFRFLWNMTENTISVPMQETGASYQYEGRDYPIYVSDGPTYNSKNYPATEYPCYYEKATATFHFNIIYFIELGYFGIADETFELTGEATDEVRRKLFAARIRSGKTVRPNLLLKKKERPLPRLF